MEIRTLFKKPQHIKAVSKMIYNEFVVKTPSTKSLNDVECYFSETKEASFPITFIATIDRKCVGTVSLFENDCAERPQYKPWLASLYVEPEFRSKKIAQQLIDYLKEYLKNLGYSEVYLKTENASAYYIKRGWDLVESIKNHHGEKVDIFKMVLINKTSI